jgi:hypothetical protein
LSKGILLNLIQPFCSLSLFLILGHPENPIKSLLKINEVFCLITEILFYFPDEPSKTFG